MIVDIMPSIDEICLVPKEISYIDSRKTDVNPFVDNKLPVFVSGMTCILNEHNFSTFSDSKFIPIMPFKENMSNELLFENSKKFWQAVSLQKFKEIYCMADLSADYRKYKYYVLIDIANGNMNKMLRLAKFAKERYGNNLVLMAGNIANPETYITYCQYGIDYVRIGVGGGNGCTTSVQTGQHTSIPYIIDEINKIKLSRLPLTDIKFRTKVIADGGISNIQRAIKCLGMGADYVMMGYMFAQCEEACSEIKEFDCKVEYPKYGEATCVSSNIPIEIPGTGVRKHLYYGQSSEPGQIDRFGEVRSNPEGTSTWVEIGWTLDSLADKFEAALRSSMSYSGASTLEEFHKTLYKVQTIHEFYSYMK